MKTKTIAPTVLGIFAVFLALGFSTAAMAAPTLPSGLYIIQMADSDMTVAATSERKNSPLMLWPYRPTATWIFKHLGGNIYTVQSNTTMLDGTCHARYACDHHLRPRQKGAALGAEAYRSILSVHQC